MNNVQFMQQNISSIRRQMSTRPHSAAHNLDRPLWTTEIQGLDLTYQQRRFQLKQPLPPTNPRASFPTASITDFFFLGPEQQHQSREFLLVDDQNNLYQQEVSCVIDQSQEECSTGQQCLPPPELQLPAYRVVSRPFSQVMASPSAISCARPRVYQTPLNQMYHSPAFSAPFSAMRPSQFSQHTFDSPFQRVDDELLLGEDYKPPRLPAPPLIKNE